MTKLTFTVKDRWICAVLPAIICVVGYLLLGVRPWQREIRLIRTEMQQQESPAVARARLESGRRENERLNSALVELRKRASSMQKAPASQLVPMPGLRPDTLYLLSRRCAEFNMAWLAARPEPEDGLSMHGWSGAERWRLELRGTYEDMVRMLDFVASSQLPILPAGVEMEPGANGVKLIDWVLTIWI